MLLIRQFQDIRNKAVSHFKRKYKLFIVVFAAQQFYRQNGLLINYNLLLCYSPLLLCCYVYENALLKYALSCLVLCYCYIYKNALLEIRLVLSKELIHTSNSTRLTNYYAKVLISASAKAGFERELGYKQQAKRLHNLKCKSICQPIV